MVSIPTLEDEIKKECALHASDFIPVYGILKLSSRTRTFLIGEIEEAYLPIIKNNLILTAYNLALIAGIAYVANLFK